MERGLSQGHLATALSLAPDEVAKVEVGKRRLRASEMFILARTFDTPIDVFFWGLDATLARDATRPSSEHTSRANPVSRARDAVTRALNKITGRTE